eukprot:5726621-Karenia_brevis.AAC.1
MLIDNEHERLRQLHVKGAAAEFILHKILELCQCVALEHKHIGAQAQQSAENISFLIERLSNGINEQSQLPHGIEKA